MELPGLLAPEVVCQIWAQVNQTQVSSPSWPLDDYWWGVDLPSGLAWALRVGIYQYESQIAFL